MMNNHELRSPQQAAVLGRKRPDGTVPQRALNEDSAGQPSSLDSSYLFSYLENDFYTRSFAKPPSPVHCGPLPSYSTPPEERRPVAPKSSGQLLPRDDAFPSSQSFIRSVTRNNSLF